LVTKPAALASAALAPGALALAGTSEATPSTLALAGTSETTPSTLALARASETTPSTLALARAYNLASRGRLLLGCCLWCSLRRLGGGSALVLIGLFSHGCPYILIPASRAASARALIFP